MVDGKVKKCLQNDLYFLEVFEMNLRADKIIN